MILALVRSMLETDRRNVSWPGARFKIKGHINARIKGNQPIISGISYLVWCYPN